MTTPEQREAFEPDISIEDVTAVVETSQPTEEPDACISIEPTQGFMHLFTFTASSRLGIKNKSHS